MVAVKSDAPGLPTRKTATETSITIEWTPPNDDGGDPIDDYKVYWDEGSGGSFILLGSSSNLLEYTVNSLTKGNTYRFKVSAVNHIGESQLSTEGSVIAATVPDAPSAAPLKVTSTKTSITVEWTAPYNGGSAITGYKVFMNGGGASTTYSDITSSGTIDASLLTFLTASTLTTGEQYKFKVLATNAVGDGNSSAESDAIIAAIKPTVPLTLQKQSAARDSITIEWTAPADTGGSPITGYKVYGNGGGANTAFSEIGTMDDLVLTFTHSGLSPPGETFKYKVSAINAVDEGPRTSEVAIIAATVPIQPAAPTRTSASLSSISVEWVAPDDGGSSILSYVLQMNEGTGSSTFVDIATNVDPGATSYTKSALATGEDFKFKLIAINAVGPSDPSPESAAITAAVTPDAPGDPFYEASSETSLQFGWTSPETAGRSDGGSALLGYIVQWDSGNGDSQFTDISVISDPSTLTFSMTSPTVTTGTQYVFRVLA